MVIASQTGRSPVEAVGSGLSGEDSALVARALEQIGSLYGDRAVSTGEPALEHALGMARCVSDLNLDAETRAAALLFAVPDFEADASRKLEAAFGATVASLVAGISKLNELRVVTRASVEAGSSPSRDTQL